MVDLCPFIAFWDLQRSQKQSRFLFQNDKILRNFGLGSKTTMTLPQLLTVQLELELFNQFKYSDHQIFDDSLTGSNYK